MRKFVHRQQTMPELILDEVDAHIHLPAIRTLVDLAQEHLLRLILIGRWRLCRACLHTDNDNILRLQGMHIEPLGMDDAEDMIARPIADLGMDLGAVGRELRQAVNERGRVVQSACITGLIDDLSSPIARVAALLVILRAERGLRIDPLWLQACLRELQLPVQVQKAWEICNELVIHHLLGCPENDDYRVGRWDFVADGQRRRDFFEVMFAEQLEKARAGGAGVN